MFLTNADLNFRIDGQHFDTLSLAQFALVGEENVENNEEMAHGHNSIRLLQVNFIPATQNPTFNICNHYKRVIIIIIVIITSS